MTLKDKVSTTAEEVKVNGKEINMSDHNNHVEVKSQGSVIKFKDLSKGFSTEAKLAPPAQSNKRIQNNF